MGRKMFSKSKKTWRTRQSILCDRQSSEREIAQIYHNRYQTQKLLGAGGMGKVFLAKDLKTGKKVAVKILKDENQWKREKEILNQLKNIKGIPKLFLAENTKDHFLVMEYIKGQSLKTYKTVHGKISEKTLILLMYKVCKVLEQVPGCGNVNRKIDAVSQTVTVTADYQGKMDDLADFLKARLRKEMPQKSWIPAVTAVETNRLQLTY